MILNQNLTELGNFKNWVAWKLIHEAGKDKPRKLPINPKTGGGAMASNPDTWSTLEQADNFAESHGYGIGFELGNSPYAVIDLDKVIQDSGEIKNYAWEIIEIMDSYTEYSPSGNGFHVWFKLDTPLTDFGCMNKNTLLDIEIYDTGRYITVTGNAYRAKPIRNATGDIWKVLEKYFAKERKEIIKESHVSNSPVDFSWDKVFNSKNGAKMKKLYEGDISEYPSHSDADLALCNCLAFWTDKNFSEMDKFFRQSGLMREKWDEKHGSKTYGELTI